MVWGEACLGTGYHWRGRSFKDITINRPLMNGGVVAEGGKLGICNDIWRMYYICTNNNVEDKLNKFKYI